MGKIKDVILNIVLRRQINSFVDNEAADMGPGKKGKGKR